MGQRLNLEIVKDGKVLANSYYHWSAYTGSTFDLVQTAYEFIRTNPIGDDRLLAVRALEATGAGMIEEDLDFMHSFRKYSGQSFKECVDRNSGILGVTKTSINNTEDWSEGTASIIIDDYNHPEICTNVVSIWDSEEYYIEECLEGDKEAAQNFRDHIVTKDYTIDGMTFSQFDDLCHELCDLNNFVKTSDGLILTEIG